ncbi:MAG: GlsB/YeaQ/YmgE family stress response membrane protein [Candidatus Acidiferrales bacterium]
MYLLLWIPVGLIVGWLAGKSLEGNGYGRSVDLIMGAGGAAVGGIIMRGAGFSGYRGTFLATFVAVCCAAVLTILVALANGRTIYSKAL